MSKSVRQRLLKLGVVSTLIAGVMFIGLLGGRSNRALAQEGDSQTFIIQAGAFSGLTGGPVELLAFTPSTLQIHRGDTVTWHINSFHNVRIGESPSNLILVPEDGGTPYLNPVVAFPSIDNGGTYTGGEANSGLPSGPDTLIFSLVVFLRHSPRHVRPDRGGGRRCGNS
jgi:plastocyanin